MTAQADVSRETQERLTCFVDLLTRWNAHINLVSRASLADVWTRHIADSAQLHGVLPHPVDHWVDLGSGGGFPGMIIAILAQDHGWPKHVTLVESDHRKAAFLRTAVRETGVNAKVQTQRAELLAPQGADVVSARALAELSTLLSHTHRHLAPGGHGIFPKGTGWRKEIDNARSEWNFSCDTAKSATQDGAVILIVAGVSRD